MLVGFTKNDKFTEMYSDNYTGFIVCTAIR